MASKRAKLCSVKVRSSSTQGQRSVRSVPLCILQRNEGKHEQSHNETTTQSGIISGSIDEDIHYENDSAPSSTGTATLSAYEIRRLRGINSWESIRDAVLQSFYEKQAMPTNQCCCECTIKEAEFRCLDCGPFQYFCLDCAKSVHSKRNVFHVLHKWQDGAFLPTYPNHCCIYPNHVCSSSYERTMACIDFRGHQHFKAIQFCQCESETQTLVKLNLWPGSPARPMVAFSFEFLDLAEGFLLEAHVSLQKFCAAMEINVPTVSPKLVQSLYTVLNTDSFDEYRFFKHSISTFHGKDLVGIYDYSFCPLCPQGDEDGTVIESMDACFGLSRKRSAGLSFSAPKYGMKYFSDQDDVDNFIDNYSSSAKTAKVDCSEFKAGEVSSALKSKGKNKLFDEKGVFGRVCRHEFPRGFINIKHGERIGYSVYEVNRILQNVGTNTKVNITYDIACTLAAHLKANPSTYSLGKDVSFAVPIFHCYGHKASCQVLFNPRKLPGFGLTDGEGIERLWAVLRPFSGMTKEMTPSKRVDLLTGVLLHQAKKILCRSGPILVAKYVKCRDTKESCENKIKDIFSNLPVPLRTTTINKWIQEEECSIKEKKNVSSNVQQSWEDKYVACLISLDLQRTILISCQSEDDVLPSRIQDIRKKIEREEKLCKNIENKHNISVRWKKGDIRYNRVVVAMEKQKHSRVLETLRHLAVERTFLITLKNKYSDGQQIAIRLSKQISRATNAIKTTILKYNVAKEQHVEVTGIPGDITFDEAKDPMSAMYSNVSIPLDPNVPPSSKRSAIDFHFLLQRCMEEEEYLNLEMERIVRFYHQQIEVITNFIQSPELSLGIKSCLTSTLWELKSSLRHVLLMFKTIGKCSTVDTPEEIRAIHLAGQSVEDSQETLTLNRIYEDYLYVGDDEDDDDNNVYDDDYDEECG